ncbi:adenylate/guanylate cyclase domain-containing protein [Stenotrophomonas lactitubi]|uniref:adenylate/guanylate cyclase domain-containing protein n=1 Tax=Stenotrophomonas lactitubi TaxID=2045214 RepID=UPI00289C262F|nr:adenylate/guanylate cyclase domain-containing protein [Stenotrophomonas lactitubi]
MTTPLSLADYNSYITAFAQSIPATIERLSEITNGRVAPAVADLSIGSARKVTAAVIFFDIRGFTRRTSSSQIEELKKTLFMLNCVIPSMMRVLFRHGAYVEKNTGDGLMAILGVGDDAATIASKALSACAEMLFVLDDIVNPVLQQYGIERVDARVGVDLGEILLARIGVPRGAANHDRSSLTAVGPAANIACKLQGMAGTNEIFCGDRLLAGESLLGRAFFVDVTPPDWTWVYSNGGARYSCWRYSRRATRPTPPTILGGGLLGGWMPRPVG